MSVLEAQRRIPLTGILNDEDDSADHAWQPRSSTPNGPHPFSPAKRQSSPFNGFPKNEEHAQSALVQARASRTPPRPLRQSSSLESPRSAWKGMPGFEELDQSWAAGSSRRSDDLKQIASASAKGLSVPTAVLRDSTQRIVSNTTDAFFDARASLALNASAGNSGVDNNGPRKTWIEHKGGKKIASATHLRPHPRPNIPALTSLTDSEAVLQPGPSNSNMRKRSQDAHTQLRDLDDGTSPVLETGATAAVAVSLRFDDALESLPQDGQARGRRRRHSASSSSSSSGSGRKQGGRPDQQVQAEGPPLVATEEGMLDTTDSTSNVAGVTASEGAEATFIHHSDASDLPPVLRPAWRKGIAGAVDPRTPGKKVKGLSNMGGDMFTPLRLQTMFKTPTPPPTSEDPINQLDVPKATVPQATSSIIVSSAQSPQPVSANVSCQLTPGLREPLVLRSTAFTFRSPVGSVQNSPFAHLATPKSSARKRGLSAEAYAHIGRTPLISSATSHLRKQRSLPLRLFRFGESPRVEKSASSSPKGDETRALEDEAALNGLSEEEAIRRFRERVQELNRAKKAEMEAVKEQMRAAPQTVSPERKRIRLATSFGLSVEPPLTNVPLAAAASLSLPPQEMDSESPRKLFRKYSAAEEVDREIEAERRADHRLRTSHYSDDERKREDEVAALEERIRARRELRMGRARGAGSDAEKSPATAILQNVIPRLPKIALVDEFGNNETIPQGMSRTYSATLIQSGRPGLSRTQSGETGSDSVRSERPIRRYASAADGIARLNGTSTTLAEMREGAEDQEVHGHQEPVQSVDPLPSPVSPQYPRKRLVEPIQEVSNETLPSPSGPTALSGSHAASSQGASPTPPRAQSSRVAAGTPPILRPSYAMSQSPNVVPNRGSGLRHEVVPSEDGDTTRSDATQLTHMSEIEQEEQTGYLQPAIAVERSDVATRQVTVAVTPLRGAANAPPYSTFSTPQPPRSILKGGPSADITPVSARLLQAPRSISFADGKTTGRMFSSSPLKGLDASWDDKDATPKARHLQSREKPPALPSMSKSSGLPKDKAARMEELLKQVAALALEADSAQDDWPEAPSAAKVQHAEDPDDTEDSWQAPSPTSRLSERQLRISSPFNASASRKSLASSRGNGFIAGRSVWNFDESAADKTFLTQASFDVAHDRIVEILTDVAPWVPDWEELKTIDLRGRRLESVVRLKEYLPQLEEVALDQNEISYFTGLPSTLKVLTVSFNQVPSIASFGHLLHLETLDISHNEIDDLSSLECLQHLRYLRADYNGIKTLNGILALEHLHSLSLQGNRLTVLNLQSASWRKLSALDVSHNRLVTIRGLASCRHLKSLNLSSNDVTHIDLKPSMPRLKVLRVSSNVRLSELDVLPAKELRTLYADFCALEKIDHLSSLNKLENLSVRQQQFEEGNSGFLWPASEVRITKRLFLTGNAFCKEVYASSRIPSPPRFTQLVYLELSACQLEVLPSDFSVLFPTVHHLNLDHNLFSTLSPGCFSGLSAMKRLSMVGCRVSKSRTLLEALDGCEALNVLDTRMNPATLGLYPPLLITTPAGSGLSINHGGGAGESEGRKKGRNGYSESSTISPANLAPIPSFEIVRPDTAVREARLLREKREEQEAQGWDKSFFHKRHPGPPPPHHSSGGGDGDGEETLTLGPYPPPPSKGAKAKCSTTSFALGGDGGTSTSTSTSHPSSISTYAQSDIRFLRTLPPTFRKKRTLHRGTLGMVCPQLTWLDGVELMDEEVVRAEEWLVGGDVG